jgi:hypothetical protein
MREPAHQPATLLVGGGVGVGCARLDDVAAPLCVEPARRPRRDALNAFLKISNDGA